jgi:hypothetical protein
MEANADGLVRDNFKRSLQAAIEQTIWQAGFHVAHCRDAHKR